MRMSVRVTIGSTNATARIGRNRAQPGRNRGCCYIRPRPWPTSPASRRRSSARVPGRPTPARIAACFCIGAGALVVLAIGAAAIGLVGFGGGSPEPGGGARRPRCCRMQLEAVKAQPGRHSLQADGFSEWNTDPPTSGPHFGFDEEREPRHRDLGRVRGAAPARPRRPQPRARRHLHLLRRGRAGRRRWPSSGRSTTTTSAAPCWRRTRSSATRSRSGPGSPTGEEAKGYLAKCPSVRREGVLLVLQRVPVQGPGALPGGLAPPGPQLRGGAGQTAAARDASGRVLHSVPPGWRNG